jgi:F-type H+-transporting ATPase subunit delta
LRKDGIICTRYARALFRSARNAGALDGVRGELAAATLALSPSREYWVNPAVPLAEKQSLLDRAVHDFGETLGPLTGSFLRVLLKNGRLDLIEGIFSAYKELADRAEGRLRADVATARALGDSQRSALVASLEAGTGKKIVLHVHEDPSLLAGLVVRVRDRVYDGSARGRLDRFVARLSAAGKGAGAGV